MLIYKSVCIFACVSALYGYILSNPSMNGWMVMRYGLNKIII